jgi:chromosome segregation ATPase
VQIKVIGRIFGVAAVGVLITACAAPQAAYNAGEPDCKTRVSQVLSDREALLAAARVEIATGKIAAAKQEAELQELRKAVAELRRDNASAHHTVSTLQQTVETAQAEVERTRQEWVQAERTKQERDLAELRVTMQTLTERMDRLSDQVRTVAAAPAVMPDEPSQPKPAIEESPHPRRRSNSAVLPIAAIEQNGTQPIREKSRLR